MLSVFNLKSSISNLQSSICHQEDDFPLVLGNSLEGNLHIPFSLKARELFSPLNQQNAVVGHQIIEAERFQLTLSIDAVQIDVIKHHRRAAIFMNEGEGRTGNVLG